MKKKLLVVAMAATMAVAGAMTAFADAPDDYEAYFSFDESVDDATGNYSLEVSGKAFADAVTTIDDVVYVDGQVNKALAVNSDGNLDGYSTGVNLADTSYTVSFIAKADSWVYATPIIWIGRADQSTENWHGFWSGFSAGWNDGIPGVGSNDSSGARVGIAPETLLNAATETSFGWTVITITFDVDTQTTVLYYDGVEVGSVEGMPVLEDDAILYIGSNYWDSPSVYYMDELYVYTRVLSADEVAAIAESGSMSEEELEEASISASIAASEAAVSESISESERISELASVQASRNAATADSSDDASDSTSDDSGNNTTTIVVVVVVVVIVVVVIAAVVLGSKKKKK